MNGLIGIRKRLERGTISSEVAYWQTVGLFSDRIHAGTMSLARAQRLFNCAWRCISGRY